MRRLRILFLTPLVLLLGCPPLADTARDTIAVANGTLKAAQVQWGPTCRAHPAQVACTTINRGIAAQNVAIDALLLYCSGGVDVVVHVPPADIPPGPHPTPKSGGTDPLTHPCIVNSAAEPKLHQALNDLNVIIGDVKRLVR